MTCKIPPEVLEYIEQVESGPYRTCREQKALAGYVRRCFETEDIHTDTKQLMNYLEAGEVFPLPTVPLGEVPTGAVGLHVLG